MLSASETVINGSPGSGHGHDSVRSNRPCRLAKYWRLAKYCRLAK